MKYRITMWATAGFMIAVWWTIVAVIVDPTVITSNTVVWTLARLTCPLMLAGSYFHFGVRLPWVLLSNAAAFGMIGLSVETLRQRLSHAN